MYILLIGIFLWSCTHLMVAAAPSLRTQLIERLSPKGYKLCFSLLIILSLALMIFGWQATLPKIVYWPAKSLATPAAVLIYLSILLFVASKFHGHINSYIRHPQLTGVLLWTSGHLMTNGDIRSLLLFGLLGLWAAAETLLINRRQQKCRQAQTSIRADITAVLISLALFIGIGSFHGDLIDITLL